MTDFLRPGDEVRVVAPSFSRHAGRHDRLAARARLRLEERGFKVTFGRHIGAVAYLGTASIGDRITDLHEAYSDPAVKTILAFTGGWSCNELLPYLDWQLAAANPKPLVGFSDITILVNALYARTGRIQYLGPNFVTLGHAAAWQYSLDHLESALAGRLPRRLYASPQWSAGTSARRQMPAQPWRVIQPGKAEGLLLGGNFGSFYFLQGTPYEPRFDRPFILLAEDDDSSGEFVVREFAGQLESFLQQDGARRFIRGIVIGRFPPSVHARWRDIAAIIRARHLADIPVVANVDFGHTVPLLTLPIGGTMRITATQSRAQLELV